MIVVIADDLTGAGEIGGIGLDYGLTVELQREFCSKTDAQLLIIDTDTRSLPPEQAGRKIRELAHRLNASGLPIEWVYKKIDSVLRGPVASELEALQEALRAVRVLLVPANPSKGRIIRNGIYLIHGKPLCESDFANDPEYPAVTSHVLQLPSLSGSRRMHLLNSSRRLPCEGIAIGQAETADDLARWSGKMDGQTIMAGAGEFFEAILRNKGYSPKMAAEEKEDRLGNRALFVCGSSSDSSRQAVRNARSLGAAICRMPEALFRSDNSEDKSIRPWCKEITRCFENSHSVVMAIDREPVGNAELAAKLGWIMAKTVSAVFRGIPLNELFVEGGATASRIVACLGWNRFEPCDHLGPGVVRMKILETDNTCLTVKPGSYPWPQSIQNVFLKGISRAD